MMYDSNSDSGLASLIKRRWRLMALTSGIVLTAGIALLSVMPKSYPSSAKLLVMRTEQRLGGMGLLHDALPQLGSLSKPLYTQVEMLRLPPSLQRVIERLNLTDAKGKPLSTESLAERIRVTPLTGTDLIEVAFRDPDPQIAQQVVAALCDVYIQSTETTRREGVRAGLKIVDEQLATVRLRLSDAEDRLTAFKTTSGSISLNQEIQASVHDLSELTTLIRTRKLHLEGQQAKAQSLQSKLRMPFDEALETAALAQNPRLRMLQDQLLVAETSPLRTQGLAPSHPDRVALEGRIALLKGELAAEMTALGKNGKASSPLDDIQISLLRELTSTEAEVMATQASILAAERSRETLSASMAPLPGTEITLVRLQREVDMASQIYQDLLQKREQARMNLSIAPSYAQVVQHPEVPERPLIPLGGQVGTVLMLASLAAGFGTASLRDLFDRRGNSNALAVYLPGTPIFCSLPLLSKAEKRNGELIVKSASSPTYLQGINTLGLALENQLIGTPGHVIALTSSSPGEGKSMTLANLALCLKDMGHRVLLVDADLRRPRIHAIFGETSPGHGLADGLSERIPPMELIRRRDDMHLVTCGSATNPSQRGRLKTHLKPLLDAWRQEYDYILIDLPPLSMVAEVAQMAKHADGMLFLGNSQKVSQAAFLSGVRLMQSVGIHLLGAISISPRDTSPEASYYLSAGEGDRA